MRNIQVSADVFQAIWAGRKPGEDNEDVILKRLLGVNAARAPAGATQAQATSGFTDRRFGVHFPEGFEIFRVYLGSHFSARVVDGSWLVNGKKVAARTINELSAAIGTKTENGWVNWNFRTPAGEVKKITVLRDPARVSRRAE